MVTWDGVGNRWPSRAEQVAALICDGASVIELGAGSQPLRAALHGRCLYDAADRWPQSTKVQFMDMNAGSWPSGHWDVAAMLGVLEYADLPGEALGEMRLLADEAIVTYSHGGRGNARELFRNDLAEEELRGLALIAGWADARIVGWWREPDVRKQAIWRLT